MKAARHSWCASPLRVPLLWSLAGGPLKGAYDRGIYGEAGAAVAAGEPDLAFRISLAISDEVPTFSIMIMCRALRKVSVGACNSLPRFTRTCVTSLVVGSTAFTT